MHSANRALSDVECHVGLGNDRFEAVCLEFLLAEGTGKKTARIFSALQVDDISSLEFRLSKNHTDIRSFFEKKRLATAGPFVLPRCSYKNTMKKASNQR